jgi:predicted ATPase
VTSLDEPTLKKELNSLVEADILEVIDDANYKKYIFRQVLIQDAAYNSILKSMRQDLHKKIAGVLEKQFADFVKSHPQIVAYHYTRAKDFNRAINFHLNSGRLLVQQSAHRDAISQLQKGLKLLEYIDEEKTRNKLELDLQITLGIPLLATKGYGAEEVGKVYERARNLSQKVGDIPQLFPALVGQYRFYLLRGDLTKAFDISELLLSWAQASLDSNFLLEATRSIGVTLFHMGEVAAGLENLEKGIEIYDPVQHGAHSQIYGTDPAVTCLSYAALAKGLLGYEQMAFEYGKKALQLAKKMKHPFSQVFALNHHAWLHQFYKETKRVDKFSRELIKVSEEYGFPFWQISGTFFQGWVFTQTDNVKGGLVQMEQSIIAFEGTGAGSVLPYFMTALAEVYLLNNQTENAINWLEQAEARAQKNREHFFDAEIYRVRGEVLYCSNPKDKKNAESLIWRAIETARRQRLKSMELRALISLFRIGGRKKETINLLRDTYEWFSEGQDTHDLKQAEKILNMNRNS